MEENMRVKIAPRAIKFYMDRKMMPVTEGLGLRNSCGPILLHIQDNEGLSLSELSSGLMVDKALITRMVKVMLDDGFIEDRCAGSRGYSLYLTEKGRDAAAVIRRGLMDVWNGLMKDLTPEEIEVFNGAVSKIVSVIEKDLRGQE